jgi:hypothetical protein
METTTESVTERITRLNLSDIGEGRLQSLTIAHPLVDDATFAKLANVKRIKRNSDSIVIPAHRYENLSRGRGWARKGKGDNVTWGERVDGGYECDKGRWVIGASDGFSRKDSVTWDVSHVTVGEQTWTIAE